MLVTDKSIYENTSYIYYTYCTKCGKSDHFRGIILISKSFLEAVKALCIHHDLHQDPLGYEYTNETSITVYNVKSNHSTMKNRFHISYHDFLTDMHDDMYIYPDEDINRFNIRVKLAMNDRLIVKVKNIVDRLINMIPELDELYDDVLFVKVPKNKIYVDDDSNEDFVIPKSVKYITQFYEQIMNEEDI